MTVSSLPYELPHSQQSQSIYTEIFISPLGLGIYDKIPVKEAAIMCKEAIVDNTEFKAIFHHVLFAFNEIELVGKQRVRAGDRPEYAHALEILKETLEPFGRSQPAT